MAIPSSAVWEVRASGAPAADAGGGGWAPVTVSTFSGTDLVVDGSNNLKVTSASHNFVTADVNGRIFISVATVGGWVGGFYTISSVSANAAILASSPAPISTTGGTWALVGQDRSQQNTVQVAIDNSTITTSITANVITFTGYTPTVADVGNGVKMLTGTNVTVGWYFITAFTGTTWTVAGAAALPTSGTTVNATGNMGGALLTLAALAGTNAMIASNKAYCTGSFSVTAGVSFAQTVVPAGGTPRTRLIGYSATRGDTGQATITLTANTGISVLAATGSGFTFEQMSVDCGSFGTSTGIAGTGLYCYIRNCKVANFTTRGIQCTALQSYVEDCEVTGGIAGATAAIDVSAADGGPVRCFVHDNACPGVKLIAQATAIFNLIVNNSGATSDGINTQYGTKILNNTIHNNGRDGIRNSTPNEAGLQWRNNILTNNGGVGITASTGTAQAAMPEWDGNVYGGGASANTGGARSLMDSLVGIYGVNAYVNVRDVTLTGSPYVGPTTGTTANFALNNTTGAGAACRAASSPSTWPGNTGTTGYLDAGAVQTRGSSTSPSTGSPGIITAT